MKFGASVRTWRHAIPIDRFAEMLEERGFESLWAPEHPAIPVHRRTPHPDGEPMPSFYWSMSDPFVALAFAARATTRLKLGTGVCLVPEHDPIQLAKTVATLDRLSGGRVLLGIGGGWLPEEMELFGTSFEKRWPVTRERVLAMKRIWTEEEPEYHGKYVDFPAVKVYPKPVQQPHPPVYIGAGSRWARQRVVDWAEGWMPRAMKPEDFGRRLADLRRRAEAAGREMSTINITVTGVEPDAAAVESFAAAGADRVILEIPEEPESAVLAALDRAVKAMRGFVEAG